MICDLAITYYQVVMAVVGEEVGSVVVGKEGGVAACDVMHFCCSPHILP